MASSLESDLHQFRNKTIELSLLAYSEQDEAKLRLKSILDSLNSLDYSVKFIEFEDGERVLTHCCRIVPLSEEFLVSKFCQLVVNVAFKQEITIGSSTYNSVMTYIIHILKNSQSWLLTDVLRALGSLLYQNGDRSVNFNAALLGDEGLLPTVVSTCKDECVKRAALQCMENMCMRGVNSTMMSDQYLHVCCDTFIHTLYEERAASTTDLGYCRIVIAALRGLTHAMNNQKGLLQERVGEVLGAIRAFMLYSGEPVRCAPLFATLLSQQDQRSTPKPVKADDTKKKKKKKKTSKKESDEPVEEKVEDVSSSVQIPEEIVEESPILQPSWRSSESEYSDPEGGAASKLRSYQAKTRISALGCLMSTVRSCDRRTMFGYWAHFLPDSNKSQSQTLFSCALKDRNQKCRLSALTALSCLLEGSKQFLSAADDTDQTRTAFTPYSATLASLVKELHVNLLHALISEQMALSVTQIIKCLGVLVENTSYQKLKPGLLTRVVKQIRPFLSHRDTNIRVASLTCMGAVLSVQAPLMEVSYILDATDGLSRNGDEVSDLSPVSPYNTPQSTSGFLTPTVAPSSMNWLLVKCVRNVNVKLLNPDLERQYEPLPVRLESLQVLTHLVQGYFTCVRQNLGLLQQVVIHCLQDPESPVQLHGAKLLEALGNVINPHASAAVPEPPVLVSSPDGAEFWTAVLSGPLSSLLQAGVSSVVRATCCDCLSTVGPHVFALLSARLRRYCLTLLLGFTQDPDHVTRSSAVRTLGVYVMYVCLRDDVTFVADVANSVLVLLEDASMIVRIKSAWSLGNVTDAMCANKDDNDEEFINDFSDLLLLKMIQGALKSCTDSDKIRIHAVRALGNILRYMPMRPLEKPIMTDVVTQAVQSLVKNVGTGAMKVRWNACYALGNVLKNVILPIGRADWTPAIFTSLCIAVRDCKNFKVRINAALALNQITNRKQLLSQGDQIEMIWSSLLKCLQSMETITDFTDYKLRERLPDQVCSTLVHLTQFLELDDLTVISKSISTNLPLVVECMTKYWEQGASERALAVGRARDRLEVLRVTCVDEYQLVTVQNLLHILTNQTHPVNQEQEAGLSWKMTSWKSAFRDTYD